MKKFFKWRVRPYLPQISSFLFGVWAAGVIGNVTSDDFTWGQTSTPSDYLLILSGLTGAVLLWLDHWLVERSMRQLDAAYEAWVAEGGLDDVTPDTPVDKTPDDE